MNELVKEMDNYKIDVCALQEIKLPGKETVIKNNYMILNSDEHGCGRGFNISRHIMHNLLDFELVN
jgi:hypothetical protein